MVQYMVMKEINVYEAKARLSEYLDMVERGVRVVICRRNQPVAELRPVAAVRTAPRPLGGTVLDVPDGFFQPLPEDLESAFYPAATPGTSTAAESSAPSRATRGPKGRAK